MADQNKETWMNKNGPYLMVGIAFLLIALAGAAMKMCG